MTKIVIKTQALTATRQRNSAEAFLLLHGVLGSSVFGTQAATSGTGTLSASSRTESPTWRLIPLYIPLERLHGGELGLLNSESSIPLFDDIPIALLQVLVFWRVDILRDYHLIFHIGVVRLHLTWRLVFEWHNRHDGEHGGSYLSL